MKNRTPHYSNDGCDLENFMYICSLKINKQLC
jgi:hypothetical protein